MLYLTINVYFMKFINTITVLLFSLLVSICTHAQNHKEIGHLEFSDTLYNFGPVNESQGVLSHKFSFVNLGPEYFVIEDVNPSCGCITPDYPTDTIHAGEKGEVVIYVDLVNHPGVFKQKVVIKGNASKEPINLYVSGYVTPSPQPLADWERTSSFKYNTIYLQKNYANFGVVSNKSIVSMEIPVYNSGTQSVNIQLDKLKLPSYAKVNLLPVKIESNQRGVLKIFFNPKEAGMLGYFAGQVEVVFLSGSTVTKVPVVVTATIKEVFTPAEQASVVGPRIQLDKGEIDFGTIKTDDKHTRDITVVNIGKSDLLLNSIRTSCSCVEAFADKTILKPGASTVIKVVFDTQDRTGAENKIVSVFTNDAANSIVTVKVRAVVTEDVPAPAGGQ
ncbi:conserved hypothetical protein [Cytophaga hutchinsonii ATCC 33406]|uniref:DUF1573 domain-containing protein n=2 Tax=Cytophaga hutchinsonii TaxID=985 RepID=A0A6N4SPQ8_CYTH3|nr:conserved hypothetical protein [Cytophaga hutchinsonii ATCC 33406]